MVIAAVPDLVVLEETRRLLFFNFDIHQILGLLVRVRNKVFITKERTKTDKKGNEKQRQGDSIEAESTRLHGYDLAVPGECAECKKDAEQNRIGKNPLKNDFRNPKQEIFKDQIEWGLMFDNEIHLLEKKNDHINEDQATQT
jgi:hypothetical protein